MPHTLTVQENQGEITYVITPGKTSLLNRIEILYVKPPDRNRYFVFCVSLFVEDKNKRIREIVYSRYILRNYLIFYIDSLFFGFKYFFPKYKNTVLEHVVWLFWNKIYKEKEEGILN